MQQPLQGIRRLGHEADNNAELLEAFGLMREDNSAQQHSNLLSRSREEASLSQLEAANQVLHVLTHVTPKQGHQTLNLHVSAATPCA